ncbi:MAG TPA: hypothetical protein VK446_13070 [Methylocystis sp.]|nr:hypothetical protein [Methylocystis sp.]
MSHARHIVFVHGLLGWGRQDFWGLAPYWGEALSCFGPQLAPHEAKCGPLSSLHDRACEIFAQIKGARVDYGAEHSEACGHARFSRDYAGRGFVPGWSAKSPVILVGHSAGAPTCLKLQSLLAEDFWGVGSSADWIEAVVSIAGALNGSLLAYQVCDDASGRVSERLSEPVASTLAVAARLLDDGNRVFDLHLDHWREEERGSLNAASFVRGADNLACDSTLHGARRANEKLLTSPDTYYFSFVTCATHAEGDAQAVDRGMALKLRAGARYQAQRADFKAPPLDGWGDGDLAIARWRANDGAISAVSQRFPLGHPVGGEGVFGREALSPGRWYYENIADAMGVSFDHLDPVHGGKWKASRATRQAHRELYRRLDELLARL